MLVYNPQSRPTAKQLIEYHPYFTSQSDINLEKPMKNVIDRAIRIQTENMKNVVIQYVKTKIDSVLFCARFCFNKEKTNDE